MIWPWQRSLVAHKHDLVRDDLFGLRDYRPQDILQHDSYLRIWPTDDKIDPSTACGTQEIQNGKSTASPGAQGEQVKQTRIISRYIGFLFLSSPRPSISGKT